MNKKQELAITAIGRALNGVDNAIGEYYLCPIGYNCLSGSNRYSRTYQSLSLSFRIREKKHIGTKIASFRDFYCSVDFDKNFNLEKAIKKVKNDFASEIKRGL